jgi:hypothetical protein
MIRDKETSLGTVKNPYLRQEGLQGAGRGVEGLNEPDKKYSSSLMTNWCDRDNAQSVAECQKRQPSPGASQMSQTPAPSHLQAPKAFSWEPHSLPNWETFSSLA